MAKKGIELNNLSSLIKNRCKTTGWALCIGAGTSLSAFPTWETLVKQLVRLDKIKKYSELTSSLSSNFSYDALIQAAKDRLSLDDDKFAKVLVTELYSEIKRKLSKPEWQFFTQVLSMRLGDLKPDEWIKFKNICTKHFKKASALSIAEIVSELIGTYKAPSAILSFNAEPLLVTLINAFTSIRSPSSKKQIIDIVTHAISNRRTNRIPYYFCHGLLPVPVSKKRGQKAESPDKLVFSEGSYLQLSNSVFSWQSSVFLDVCSSKSVVFVGVSLSDSNMRRWLSWICTNRIQEIKERSGSLSVSTSHFWINKKPDSNEETLWIESSVAHLGVRLIWINDWSEVGQALRILLDV